MESLDYTKLFDVGVLVYLREEFLKSTTIPGTWQEDVQIAGCKGPLKVVEVNDHSIIVKAGENRYYLTLDYIQTFQLSNYLDDPEILYAFARNQKNYGRYRNISSDLMHAFNWTSTPEGKSFWALVYSGHKVSSPTIESKQEKTIQNKENHEIRLQKPKASVIRGARPKGSRIRCSEHKASIRSRQISYTACHR